MESSPQEIAGSVVAKMKQMKRPIFETELGKLYQADCLDVLPKMENKTTDLVLADPPFNLGKDYGESIVAYPYK
jgi:site-specific DNA-methyltransferase (adenine-specific)